MKNIEVTTMCYIRKDNAYLMLYRNKREKDINKGKWIGVGGHLIEGETPEECIKREVFEETGLTLLNYQLCGKLIFEIDDINEICYLYISDSFDGKLKDCDEGELHWIPMNQIKELNLWEGDYHFLEKINPFEKYFEMKLVYKNDCLVEYEVLK